MTCRILFWVQHLLGSGHLRRSMAIASAAAAEGMEVLLVSGGMPLPWRGPEEVQTLQLPPVRAADSSFRILVGPDGAPFDDAMRERRRSLLIEAWESWRPDILVTEMFPFGRRQFRSELLPLLSLARDKGRKVPVVCSVRDVLVSKPADKWRAMRDLCLTAFDHVLVHGDENLVSFDATCPFADELGARLRYTGFVLTEDMPAASCDRSLILASAGGGAVGGTLLRTTVEAARLLSDLERPWLLLGGSNSSRTALEQLRRIAPPAMTIEHHRSDFPSLLARADLSISQAGYNTVAEALAAGTRMVLVPFADQGEDEQTLRAEALARRGFAIHLSEAGLDPRALAGAIRTSLSVPRPSSRFRLDGARETARILRELAT